MIKAVRSALLWATLALSVSALYVGPYVGEISREGLVSVAQDRRITFAVALKLRNGKEMHDTLMQVSDPRSDMYGKYLSVSEIQSRFGPEQKTVDQVMNWLTSAMPEADVQLNMQGDMIMVTASVGSIESAFQTRLEYHTHKHNKEVRPALRAVESITVPQHLHDAISFVSINSPISRYVPMSGSTLRSSNRLRGMHDSLQPGQVNVQTGNKAVSLGFFVTCGDGELNQDATPCSSAGDVPTITAQFQDYDEVFPPVAYTMPGSAVKCYDAAGNTCDGTTPGTDCICMVRVDNIQMYRSLTASVMGRFANGSTIAFGESLDFALADTATAQMLYDLYQVPYGIKVKHGSTVAVAEFYDEFFSNSDLSAFMKLSGLEDQQIDDANVSGYNNQSNPGGEAQLDVEYLLALAQDAELSFYSIPTYNPYSEENEDFLAWLYIVGNETTPPLVHSLSYGDIEQVIFDPSNPGSEEYGNRCDQEFLKMGLRGLSVIVSSGDDGLASFAIRDDPAWACAEAHPSWPASSPYVTTVGATMLTDQYLPFCQSIYQDREGDLPVQCTGVAETTCSSLLGGVIVPGGGFSNVYDREEYAPWQLDAVSKYLDLEGVTPTSDGYFNRDGRGFPDLAAYGSNYFVYLDGDIVRESGTSASAPVVAGMVALWNDMRLAYGQPSMGFINPFLYQAGADHPEAFYDVTTGDNACGAGRSRTAINCCDEYFSASAGWDAVNGLGTPKFDVLSNLVLNQNTKYPSQGSILTADESVVCDCKNGDDGDDADVTLVIAALVISIVSVLAGLGSLYFVFSRRSNDEQSHRLMID